MKDKQKEIMKMGMMKQLGIGLFNKIQKNQHAVNVGAGAFGAGIGLASGSQDDSSPVFWGTMGAALGGMAGVGAGYGLYKGLLGMQKAGKFSSNPNIGAGISGTGVGRTFTRSRRGR